MVKNPVSQRERLLAEYYSTAGQYDWRWERYSATTTAETLEACGDLSRRVLLDVGCGTGQLLAAAGAGGAGAQGIGVDASSAMLEVARQRLGAGPGLLVGCAEALPVATASVDVAATSSVLHFCEEPDLAVDELARVVRPGGRVVITDWSGETFGMRMHIAALRACGYAAGHLVRIDELCGSLCSAGLQVSSVKLYRASPGWQVFTVAAEKP